MRSCGPSLGPNLHQQVCEHPVKRLSFGRRRLICCWWLPTLLSSSSTSGPRAARSCSETYPRHSLDIIRQVKLLLTVSAAKIEHSRSQRQSSVSVYPATSQSASA